MTCCTISKLCLQTIAKSLGNPPKLAAKNPDFFICRRPPLPFVSRLLMTIETAPSPLNFQHQDHDLPSPRAALRPITLGMHITTTD